MEEEELDKVLKHKGAMIIVATNVLQSGVTIKGLNYGWFNGLGNRKETIKGKSAVKGYVLSKAEMLQWFGRIGRTEHGTIYWTESEIELFESRDYMPTAEIQRIPLEETILMFQSMDLNLKTIECLNQPRFENICQSEKLLIQLECLDNNGIITQLGLKVFREGVGLRGGLLQIYGAELGVPNLVRKMALMMGSNHPFRNANYYNFSKLLKGLEYSDYMVWVKIIEHFIEQYGYNVKPMDYEMFKKECEEAGLFRRSLISLMKRFKYIDNGFSDEVQDQTQVKHLIQEIFKKSFADTVLTKEDRYWETIDGINPKISNNSYASIFEAKKIVGEINSIPTSRGSLILLEGITIIE